MAQHVSDDAIYQYINKLSSATSYDVCAAFGLSESTVRRALARLEKSGKLRRFRGGAAVLPPSATAYDQRLGQFTAIKNAIARKAAEYVNEGSTIIMLGGTTVSAMCPYLQGKSLNVITNSLAVVEQLKGSPSIKLIMLGGIYSHEEYEFVGNIATMGLRIMRADSLFVSCVGFAPDVGFVTNDINAVEFYKICMKNADTTFMLADSSKAQCAGLAIFATTDEVDCLITDKNLPPEGFNDLHVDICK